MNDSDKKFLAEIERQMAEHFGYGGEPSTGYCANPDCGAHVTEHLSKRSAGCPFVSIACQKDKKRQHVWSSAADNYGYACKHCKRRNPQYFPGDWGLTQAYLFHACNDFVPFLITHLKESLERESASAYRLSILLAVIHGDGGHYESAHGTEKASTDAETVVCVLRRKLDALQYQESAVRELHREIQPPEHYGLGKLCIGCGDDWPCSTIRILDGEVGASLRSGPADQEATT